MNAEKLVVGLTGMPGSGKSVVVDAAKTEGYAIVTMGDVIREETKMRGLELNPENMGKVMLDLRAIGGNSVIAKKCVPRIEQQKNRKVIVDGIRSLGEVDVFQTNFSKFALVAVYASPETRFHRLNNRGRSDDPKSWETFFERDLRELGVGLGNAIAVADYLIINETDQDTVKAQAKEVLRRIEEKWLK